MTQHAPSGARLIAYLNAVRAASKRAYPSNELHADLWHMGWTARRVGRSRTDYAPPDEGRYAAPTVTLERINAWRCGWDAARGTWTEVGDDYLPREAAAV